MDKIIKNLVGIAVLLGYLSLGVTPSLVAMTVGMGGLPVQSTPYDHKMSEAGLLASHFPVYQTESAESLFMKARSIRYVPDNPRMDYWQSAGETESRWAGDCEDKAIWLYTQLKKNGYHNVRLVIGRYRSIGNGFHVWVTFGEEQNEGLYLLDPTAQKRLWKSVDFSEGFYKALFSFDGFTRYSHNG
jgi:hypothetical protein